jgi:hypothetical protein
MARTESVIHQFGLKFDLADDEDGEAFLVHMRTAVVTMERNVLRNFRR